MQQRCFCFNNSDALHCKESIAIGGSRGSRQCLISISIPCQDAVFQDDLVIPVLELKWFSMPTRSNFSCPGLCGVIKILGGVYS